MDRSRNAYAHAIVEAAMPTLPDDIGMIVITFEPTEENLATANIASNLPEDQVAELLKNVAFGYDDGIRVRVDHD